MSEIGYGELRLLISYWYYKNVDLGAMLARYFDKPYPEIFADSGAFSAMTQGVDIPIQEYAEWLHTNKEFFCAYANLDVIGDAEATWQNQIELERLDLDPVPAFHVTEDFIWLEKYVERYPYIALGVAGKQARGGLMSWLVRCFRIAGDRAVFHGFALTSWRIMKSFPWYSVDSSSWGQGFRYGQVPLFDSRRGRFIKVALGDYEGWTRYNWIVRGMGFDPLDFADRARYDRAKVCAISALSYMKAEAWLRKLHGEIKIPKRTDAPVVPRAHLVTGASGPSAELGGNMSMAAMAKAGLGAGGPRLHLADTSSGVNYRDAATGVRIHLVDTPGVKRGPDTSHIRRESD